MAKQVAKIKLTGRLAKNHLTALERNQLTLTPTQETSYQPFLFNNLIILVDE